MNAQTVEQWALARGLTFAEVEAHLAKIQAVPEGSADPTPGPLAVAFPTRRVSVSRLHVRPLVAADFPILKLLNSPLYRQMLEAAKPAEQREATPFTDQDQWEMIWQFTHDCETVEVAVLRGREYFAALARKEVAHSMNPFVASQIMDAIGRQFADSFKTAVGYKSSGGSEDETKVFTKPPPMPKTASVGGSTTSPGSSTSSRP